MNKGEFIQLLNKPNTVSTEQVVGLQNVVSEYPYFSSAQMLLTKAFHQTENLNFEKSLRKTAAYAPNRTKLHFLLFNNLEKKVDKVEDKTLSVVKEDKTLVSKIKDKPFEPTPVASLKSEPKLTKTISTPLTKEPLQVNKQESTIDVKKSEAKNNSEVTEKPTVENELTKEVEENSTEENSIVELENISAILPEPILETEKFTVDLTAVEKKANESEANDNLENQIIASAINSSVILEVSNEIPDLNELTAIHLKDEIREQEIADPKKSFDHEQPHSFSDWIKHYGKSEENEEKWTPEVVSEELYAPTTPVKSDFYSPSKMAKLSVQDKGDLVTETLASIYEDQSHFEKAISTFEKLQLKYPEKSSYFAGRIKEIQNKINL